MATEIERKFLVKNNNWKYGDGVIDGLILYQGYLVNEKEATIRLRYLGASEKGYITIKGQKDNISCSEYEIEIDNRVICEAILISIPPEQSLIKNRYLVPYADHDWEIDVYFGENSGLVVAEIELDSEDETFEVPEWLGLEVTYDERYLNCNLVKNPYRNWKDASI